MMIKPGDMISRVDDHFGEIGCPVEYEATRVIIIYT